MKFRSFFHADLLRGVLANAFVQFVIVIVQLGVIPILANKWGARTYGVWIILSTIPAYLAFSDLGLATAAGNLMTIHNANGQKSIVIKIFHSAFLVVLASSSLMLVIGILFSQVSINLTYWSKDWRFLEDFKVPFCLMLIYSCLTLYGSLIQAAYKASGNYSTGTALFGTGLLFENSLLIAAVEFLNGGLELAAGALLVGRSISLIFQTVKLSLIVKWLPLGISNADYLTVKHLIKPAVAVLAIPVAQMIYLHAPGILIGSVLGAAFVATFSTTRTLTRSAIQIVSMLNHSLMPKFSAYFGASDKNLMLSGFRLTWISSAALGWPVLIVILIYGQDIFLIWTRNSIPYDRDLMVLMVLAAMINVIWHPISNLILAAGKQARYSFVYLFIAALCLALGSLLLNHFGLRAIGLSMLLTDVIMSAYIFMIFSSTLNLSLK